jgi:prophage DNA circulation protein
MHTHNEGVPAKSKSRRITKNKEDNRVDGQKDSSGGGNKFAPKRSTETVINRPVCIEPRFSTLNDHDNADGGEKCVLVDRISDKSQILTNRAQVAANCAVRTAMATKNGIDTVEKVVRCMRTIADAMNDVVESVENLKQHVQNIRNTATTVEDIADRAHTTVKNAINKSVSSENQLMESDLMRKSMKQVVRLINEEASITSESFVNIVSDIEECVKTTNAAARRIEEGYKTANEARSAMDRVMDLVEEVSGQIDGIFEIADEVNTGSNDMIRIIEELVHDVTASSEQLERMSGELNGYLERFQSYGQVIDSITTKTTEIFDHNRLQSPGEREYSAINTGW